MRSVAFVLAGVAFGLLVTSSQAGIIGVSSCDGIADLPGAGWTALEPAPLQANLSQGTLQSTVYNQVYESDSGLYAYLYQVQNTGTTGQNSVEVFTISPFGGADDSTVIGYFTGATAPEGFLSPLSRPPQNQAAVDTDPTVISIYFTRLASAAIAPGQHSDVIYILSELSPGEVQGNVIDGLVASGAVFGPVPEPGSLGLLVASGAMFVCRRRRAT